MLVDRAAEDRCQRPSEPSRMGAGKIVAGDQRIGLLGSPLVGPQRRALPLGCLALRSVQPGLRHRDLDPPEGPQQRPRSVTVPVSGDTARAISLLASPLWAA